MTTEDKDNRLPAEEALESEEKEEEDISHKYEKIKKDLSDIVREEKQLKNYLKINVFDYAQNKQNVEDVFAIHHASMSFLDVDPDTHKVNPNIPVVEVNGLSKTYASRKVPSLVNLNFRLYLGDVHVIVGPSGSGKTTLFNCLRGIEDYEGEILIEGKPLNSHPDFYSEQLISFVSSELGWDSYATVEDIISSRFQELNRSDIEAQNYIRSSLESMGLSYLRNLNVIDLTLLEKRKVQIVVALITDPHVIVFDEVFLGLQQHERFEMMVILSKLKNNERSILLMTNSFSDMSKLANSMTILSEGKIYYTGVSDALLYNKIVNYSISVNENEKTVEILNRLDGCSFAYNEAIDAFLVNFDGNLTLLKFQQECASNGILVREMKQLEARVEDLFALLKHSGNREAIKSINTHFFFAP